MRFPHRAQWGSATVSVLLVHAERKASSEYRGRPKGASSNNSEFCGKCPEPFPLAAGAVPRHFARVREPPQMQFAENANCSPPLAQISALHGLGGQPRIAVDTERRYRGTEACPVWPPGASFSCEGDMSDCLKREGLRSIGDTAHELT